MIYKERDIKDKTRTAGKMKIRPQAEKKLLDTILRAKEGKLDLGKGVKIEIEDILLDEKEIRNKEIRVKKEKIPSSVIFEELLQEGSQYRIKTPEGIEVIYRPHDKKTPYSFRGELEFRVKGNPDAKRITKVLTFLEKLGLNTAPPTAEQEELLYLEKQGYATKEKQKSKEYAALIERLKTEELPIKKKIKELRAYWEKKLGVDDITKLPEYNPRGEYSMDCVSNDPSKKAGYRVHYRFDISEKKLKEELEGYSLSHTVTGQGENNIISVLDNILANSGAMVSNVEKTRIGVPVHGMSSAEDLRVGGGNYFFTRIALPPKDNPLLSDAMLFFKLNSLRRMDAIAYEYDSYGNTHEDNIQKYRKTEIEEWWAHGYKQANEVILKNQLNFIENIDTIYAESPEVREEIVKVLKKHGWETLPDGRKAEDIVVGK